MEASAGFGLLGEKLRNRRGEGPWATRVHIYNAASVFRKQRGKRKPNPENIAFRIRDP